MNKSTRFFLFRTEQWPLLLYLLKWLFIALIIGTLTGFVSGFFLISLNWVTEFRTSHSIIIWGLPIAGLFIGLLYHYYGQDVIKGNNQLIDEIQQPQRIIPIKMAPLVLIGTLITHLFGGSAGREGTAVQVGGSIADQFSRWFGIKARDRKILIIMGISAGFSSVFGTPLAGTIFSLEVLIIGRIRYDALLPSLLAAIVANTVCHLTGATHTNYFVQKYSSFDVGFMIWAIIGGIFFGLAALLFSKTGDFFTHFFKKITYPPFRPVLGGLILAIVFFLLQTSEFAGLGIDIIQRSFTQIESPKIFILKLIFTAFTLSAGFKGGEVTPLFYIGATLGSTLSALLPIPTDLLAALGFVAVFAGATNTPIACIFMGIELFGIQSGVYISLAVITAYLFSGHSGIYGSQVIGSPKHALYIRKKGKKLHPFDS